MTISGNRLNGIGCLSLVSLSLLLLSTRSFLDCGSSLLLAGAGGSALTRFIKNKWKELEPLYRFCLTWHPWKLIRPPSVLGTSEDNSSDMMVAIGSQVLLSLKKKSQEGSILQQGQNDLEVEYYIEKRVDGSEPSVAIVNPGPLDKGV
jgi:hypothetical protein